MRHASGVGARRARRALRAACAGIALAAGIAAAASGDTDADAAVARLAARAAQQPDDLALQWIALIGDRDSSSAARTVMRLQRREPRNAAAWALSLAVPGTGTDERTALSHMARGTVYDEHQGTAARAIAAELRAAGVVDDVNRRAWLAADSGSLAGHLFATCAPRGAEPRGSLRTACTAAMHVVFRRSTDLSTIANAQRVLRALHALDGREHERARRIAWWRDTTERRIDYDDALERAWFDALVASDDAPATLEAFARRFGASDPPPDWRWPPPDAPVDPPVIH